MNNTIGRPRGRCLPARRLVVAGAVALVTVWLGVRSTDAQAATAPAGVGSVAATPASGGGGQGASGVRQTQADDYTRYELLAPDTGQFKIVYEVSATAAGSTAFFNVIRKGSVATDEAVYDMMTGLPLRFEVVSGTRARTEGLATADPETDYIRIQLARPVPVDGEARLRIEKTYRDAQSYFRQGDLIVFDRSLGIARNAVVLPAGYELVGCNVPSQVAAEADGRIRISFLNQTPAAMPLVVKGRRLPEGGAGGREPGRSPAKAAGTAAPSGRTPPSISAPRPATAQAAAGSAAAPAAAPPPARTAPSISVPRPAAPASPAAGAAATGRIRLSRLAERARQDREIVYFLHQPETHAFSLYHDYTESREGVSTYLNVVRQGSTVSNPSARVLDTGAELEWAILKGDAITRAGLTIGEAVQPETEVVVIRFPAVKKGESIRLRIAETYTDPTRFTVDDGELVWDRAFGRPRNAVVLPEGWYLTGSSIPARVALEPDGRLRLDFWNGRPDEIQVLLTAKRRQAATPGDTR